MNNHENKEVVVKLRSVIKSRSSYYISIPQEFIRKHGIQKGEKLPVLANHILKIVPMKETQQIEFTTQMNECLLFTQNNPSVLFFSTPL
jgi:hypothetical protein